MGRADEINTCTGCNQACLDRIFTERAATCLVNPRAGREIEFKDGRSDSPRRFAVVGGGPAGMAFAVNAAQRGHHVTLFEAGPELGGQLNMAKQVPGKSEFHEMLRYFKVSPRFRASIIQRCWAASMCSRSAQTSVKRVAIIGAGGIGFDVAEFLVGDNRESTDTAAFLGAWGVDPAIKSPGGLAKPAQHSPRRSVHMFQRKAESLGKNLGKSTGWILRAKLRKANVAITGGVSYDAIDDRGLHYTVNGEKRVLEVDNVILCAGQNENRALHDALLRRGVKTHLIGGADVAVELDALRAIDQATRLAVSF